MRKDWWLLPFIIIVFIACGKKPVFEEYIDIKDEIWNRYDVKQFQVNVPVAGNYDITIDLRHTTDYEYANLWCFITTRSVENNELKDTINIKIAEPDGRWLGKGGSIKTLEQSIRKNPVYLPQGLVIFRIEQGMRTELLKGVKNIGLRLQNSEPALQNDVTSHNNNKNN